MTTQPRPTARSLALAGTKLTSLKLLLVIALAHVVVDTVALSVQPLWPDLRSRLALGDAEFQTVYLLWNVANSMLQLPIAYWADRHEARWLVYAGPILGTACVGCVGFADSFLALCCLLTLGGIGIAAFHPEAAALAASAMPENRSRALSVFSIGGYLGQAIGPLYAGQLSAAYGLTGLAWTIAWGWVAMAVVGFGVRCAPVHAAVRPDTAGAQPLSRGKIAAVSLLVVVGVLRVAPMAGVPLALAFSIKESGGSNADVGFAQSVFMAAIGAGSLACAVFVRSHHERLAFWLLPSVAAAALFVCPSAMGTPLMVFIAITGLTVGVTLPMLVSFGQQLLPHGQRVASGLMMGVTWAIASPIAVGTIELFEHLQSPANSLYAFAAILGISSALCYLMPVERLRTNPP